MFLYYRSACHFQLKNYRECLTDIELALEAGYPIQMCNKLYIRQCKCLLELSRIPEAQVAFDKAIDAIDRSGEFRVNCRKTYGWLKLYFNPNWHEL